MSRPGQPLVLLRLVLEANGLRATRLHDGTLTAAQRGILWRDLQTRLWFGGADPRRLEAGSDPEAVMIRDFISAPCPETGQPPPTPWAAQTR